MKWLWTWLVMWWLGALSPALAATVHLAWDASAGAEGYCVRALPGPFGNDGRIFDVETNCDAVLDLAPGGWTIFVEAYTAGTNWDGTLYRIASAPSNAVRLAVSRFERRATHNNGGHGHGAFRTG